MDDLFSGLRNLSILAGLVDARGRRMIVARHE
jgi:hypothetical protein